MEKGYIAPEAALKKLRVAKGLGQTVYIYGATGYGKTELVRQYLSRRRHRYISCAEDAAGLTEAAQSAGEEKEGEPRSVVVADDLHLLKNAQGRKAVLSLAGCQDIWLILVCRSPIPAWLMPLYIKGSFLVITEDDLRLGEKEISAYMGAQGLTLMGEELAFVAERSRGNAYIVRHAALKMLEGIRHTERGVLMSLGEWKDKITIQKSVAGNDKAGNHVLSWQDYYTCHAYVNNLSGSEYWEAAQLNAEKEIFFLIRYCSEAAAIDTEHFRILFREQIYNITFIDNVKYQNKTLKLRAALEKR